MKKFIVISLIFHSLLMGVFYFSDYFLISSLFKQNTQLIEDSVRVDLVAMPSELLKDSRNKPKKLIVSRKEKKVVPKKVVEPIVKKPIEKTKPKVIPKPEVIKEEVKEVLEEKKVEKVIPEEVKEVEKPKLEEKVVLEKTEAEAEAEENVEKDDLVEKEKANNQKVNKNIGSLDELVKMGNKISKGESLDSGKISDEVLISLDSYALRVKEKIRSFWELPAHLIDEGHECEVQIFIDERGQVLKTIFKSKSKSDTYNQIVYRVIRLAQPFASPPEEIKEKVRRGYIGLGFPF